MSRSAQAASKEWQRKGTPSARIALMSSGVQPSPVGSVKWVPLVVGEHGVDPVGHGRDEAAKEVARDTPRRLLVRLGEGELGRAVDGHEEVELALLGPDLGDVEVEE